MSTSTLLDEVELDQVEARVEKEIHLSKIWKWNAMIADLERGYNTLFDRGCGEMAISMMCTLMDQAEEDRLKCMKTYWRLVKEEMALDHVKRHITEGECSDGFCRGMCELYL